MAWARGVLPIVSRPLTMAWLLTFCGVFLELPHLAAALRAE